VSKTPTAKETRSCVEAGGAWLLAIAAALAWLLTPGGTWVDRAIGLAIPLCAWLHGWRRRRAFGSAVFGVLLWLLWPLGYAAERLTYRTVNHAMLPSYQLRELVEAQTRFRDGDLEGDGVLDYATIDELRATHSVPEYALRTTGVYQAQIYVPPQTSEFLWMAVVNSTLPDDLNFAVTQDGQLYASMEPLETNPGCEPPPNALPYPEEWETLEAMLPPPPTTLGWSGASETLGPPIAGGLLLALAVWSLCPLPWERSEAAPSDASAADATDAAPADGSLSAGESADDPAGGDR